MIDDICKVIAKRTPFYAKEIKIAFSHCQSWDLIFAAISVAEKFGLSLDTAIDIICEFKVAQNDR
jgi:hypothetical protein